MLTDTYNLLVNTKQLAYRTATQGVTGDVWYYETYTDRWVTFSVPLNEMGEFPFEKTVMAHQLIKWINE